MQDPSHSLAPLLCQVAALGREIFIHGQQEASLHLGLPQHPKAVIALVAVMPLAPPTSTGAPSAANDNPEG